MYVPGLAYNYTCLLFKGTKILGWATHPYPDDSSNFNALVAELYSFSLK